MKITRITNLRIITYKRSWQRVGFPTNLGRVLALRKWIEEIALQRQPATPALSHASSSSFQFPFHPFISFRLIPPISFSFSPLPILLCFTLAAVILISLIPLATRSTSSAIIASRISTLPFAECALPSQSTWSKTSLKSDHLTLYSYQPIDFHWN